MFHIEFRQFPHNACHFNLTDPELGAIVLPWAREEWVEVGERKWNPHEAKLTIIEGPELPLDQLTMGRGWRHAEREGEDATERVIGEAKAYLQTTAERDAPGRSSPSPGDAQPAPTAHDTLLADSIGLELLALLDEGAVPLSQVLLLAQERLAGQPASESLALAERAVFSLLGKHMIVLQRDARQAEDGAGGAGGSDGVEVLSEEQIEPALRAIQSWSSQGQPGVVRVRRA